MHLRPVDLLRNVSANRPIVGERGPRLSFYFPSVFLVPTQGLECVPAFVKHGYQDILCLMQADQLLSVSANRPVVCGRGPRLNFLFPSVFLILTQHLRFVDSQFVAADRDRSLNILEYLSTPVFLRRTSSPTN